MTTKKTPPTKVINKVRRSIGGSKNIPVKTIKPTTVYKNA